MTDRDRVPVSSHVSEKPPHAPHVPYTVVPQVVPSVSRVQLPVSGEVLGVHVPPLHAYVVTLRDRLPVSSHVSEKLAHALQLP